MVQPRRGPSRVNVARAKHPVTGTSPPTFNASNCFQRFAAPFVAVFRVLTFPHIGPTERPALRSPRSATRTQARHVPARRKERAASVQERSHVVKRGNCALWAGRASRWPTRAITAVSLSGNALARCGSQAPSWSLPGAGIACQTAGLAQQSRGGSSGPVVASLLPGR